MGRQSTKQQSFMMPAKELSCLRKFRTVRIGGRPNRQEFFVSVFRCFAVTLHFRGTSKAENQFGPVRRSAQCFLKLVGCLRRAVEFQQEISAELVRGDYRVGWLREIGD